MRIVRATADKQRKAEGQPGEHESSDLLEGSDRD
jgi:hypothetical protein